jgi:hypothetical protein
LRGSRGFGAKRLTAPTFSMESDRQVTRAGGMVVVKFGNAAVAS